MPGLWVVEPRGGIELSRHTVAAYPLPVTAHRYFTACHHFERTLGCVFYAALRCSNLIVSAALLSATHCEAVLTRSTDGAMRSIRQQEQRSADDDQTVRLNKHVSHRKREHRLVGVA